MGVTLGMLHDPACGSSQVGGCEGQMNSGPPQPLRTGRGMGVGGIFLGSHLGSQPPGEIPPLASWVQRRTWPFLPSLEVLDAGLSWKRPGLAGACSCQLGPWLFPGEPQGTSSYFHLPVPGGQAPGAMVSGAAGAPESLLILWGDRWHFRVAGGGLAGLSAAASHPSGLSCVASWVRAHRRSSLIPTHPL